MTVDLEAASPPYILVVDRALQLIIEYRPTIQGDIATLFSWV
jgi:hypothetical protein